MQTKAFLPLWREAMAAEESGTLPKLEKIKKERERKMEEVQK